MCSSESNSDDDEEDEVVDKYQQEKESSKDTEESESHVELGMQLSPTKDPENQKIYFTYMYLSSLRVSFPIIVSLYI